MNKTAYLEGYLDKTAAGFLGKQAPQPWHQRLGNYFGVDTRSSEDVRGQNLDSARFQARKRRERASKPSNFMGGASTPISPKAPQKQYQNPQGRAVAGASTTSRGSAQPAAVKNVKRQPIAPASGLAGGV